MGVCCSLGVNYNYVLYSIHPFIYPPSILLQSRRTTNFTTSPKTPHHTRLHLEPALSSDLSLKVSTPGLRRLQPHHHLVQLLHQLRLQLLLAARHVRPGVPSSRHRPGGGSGRLVISGRRGVRGWGGRRARLKSLREARQGIVTTQAVLLG